MATRNRDSIDSWRRRGWLHLVAFGVVLKKDFCSKVHRHCTVNEAGTIVDALVENGHMCLTW